MSGPPETPIPYADQIACVDRELGYRRRVYADRVAAGKMTSALAARELARMEAVKRTLELVAALEKDRLEISDRLARDENVGTLEESIWATIEQLVEEARPQGGEQRELF